MAPLAIDTERRHAVVALHVDGCRHRRFSRDQARAAYYAHSRTARYRRFLLGESASNDCACSHGKSS